ncbi:MAG TPA: hypothetical protein VL359_09215 [bacterium]|nr:hypothetical protein [bacterium]
MTRGIKWLVLVLLALLLVAVTPSSEAQTPTNPVSVYSIWVRLSLRGYSQEEIESLLRNMDSKTLEEVKGRLRRTVLSNLRLKQVRQHYLAARDKGDLEDVYSSIETEIRFAGLENDTELRYEIRERLGIPFDRL